MRSYEATVRTTAGSSTLPVISIFGIAGVGGWLREVHLFNTTATSVALILQRLTTAGTPGIAITAAKVGDPGSQGNAQLTPFTTHTGAPTLGNALRRVMLGAAIGSGIIWTFRAPGIFIPAGTANGIGVIPAATGQALDATLVWEE